MPIDTVSLRKKEANIKQYGLDNPNHIVFKKIN